MNLIVGATGVLGKALMELLPERHAYTRRLEQEPYAPGYECAFLCAGTKGFAECEGNRAAFRADVDGNIRLAKSLLSHQTFVVFVSTDGVEWGGHTAYARNRLIVEMALIMTPRVAIFRPAKFGPENVAEVAKACARVGLERIEGLTRWP